MTAFARRVTNPAFRGSDTGFGFNAIHGPMIDSEQGGDATVANLARVEAHDQVGALLTGHANLFGSEVVLAVCDPALRAFGIAERNPDVAGECLLGGLHQIVLGFKGVQEFDFQILGDPTSFLFGVVGLS